MQQNDKKLNLGRHYVYVPFVKSDNKSAETLKENENENKNKPLLFYHNQQTELPGIIGAVRKAYLTGSILNLSPEFVSLAAIQFISAFSTFTKVENFLLTFKPELEKTYEYRAGLSINSMLDDIIFKPSLSKLHPLLEIKSNALSQESTTTTNSKDVPTLGVSTIETEGIQYLQQYFSDIDSNQKPFVFPVNYKVDQGIDQCGVLPPAVRLTTKQQLGEPICSSVESQNNNGDVSSIFEQRMEHANQMKIAGLKTMSPLVHGIALLMEPTTVINVGVATEVSTTPKDIVSLQKGTSPKGIVGLRLYGHETEWIDLKTNIQQLSEFCSLPKESVRALLNLLSMLISASSKNSVDRSRVWSRLRKNFYYIVPSENNTNETICGEEKGFVMNLVSQTNLKRIDRFLQEMRLAQTKTPSVIYEYLLPKLNNLYRLFCEETSKLNVTITYPNHAVIPLQLTSGWGYSKQLNGILSATDSKNINHKKTISVVTPTTRLQIYHKSKILWTKEFICSRNLVASTAATATAITSTVHKKGTKRPHDLNDDDKKTPISSADEKNKNKDNKTTIGHPPVENSQDTNDGWIWITRKKPILTSISSVFK
jgi:hypothetical protein